MTAAPLSPRVQRFKDQFDKKHQLLGSEGAPKAVEETERLNEYLDTKDRLLERPLPEGGGFFKRCFNQSHGWRSIDEFPADGSSADYLYSRCKDCKKDANLRLRQAKISGLPGRPSSAPATKVEWGKITVGFAAVVDEDRRNRFRQLEQQFREGITQGLGGAYRPLNGNVFKWRT